MGERPCSFSLQRSKENEACIPARPDDFNHTQRHTTPSLILPLE